jgi:E3 ubiquitin-protein ligase DOA10
MTYEQFSALQTWLVQAFAPAIELWLALFVVAVVFMSIYLVFMISVRSGISKF